MRLRLDRLSTAATLLALLLAASFGVAPSSAEPAASDERRAQQADVRLIGPAEFRLRFENRTVHLSWDGTHYGSEYYLPGDRSVWVLGDGDCQPGKWRYHDEGYCFTYPGVAEQCWWVYEHSGQMYAQSKQNGQTLLIDAVVERPIVCDPDLLS